MSRGETWNTYLKGKFLCTAHKNFIYIEYSLPPFLSVCLSLTIYIPDHHGIYIRFTLSESSYICHHRATSQRPQCVQPCRDTGDNIGLYPGAATRCSTFYISIKKFVTILITLHHISTILCFNVLYTVFNGTQYSCTVQ
jgi:hypothetical protein